ncbi:MAG TPA: polysaccharide biosynthesis tyrosine autokinase [Bacteroidales bacterium]|nr:polysaccharide biosynthesis tyrosine autokinase [Bacteroidales bacterium]
MTKGSFNEDNIDIKGLIFRHLHYWWLFVLGVFLALVIAYSYNRLEEPVYRVHSKVLISDPTKGLNRNALLAELGAFPTRSGFHDQIIILRSTSMVDSVLQRMNLEVYYFEITNRIFGFKRTRESYDETPFVVNLDWLTPNSNDLTVFLEIVDENLFVLEENSEFGIRKQTMRFGELFYNHHFRFNLNLTENFSPDRHIGKTFMFVVRNQDSQIGEYVGNLQVQPHNEDAWILDVFFVATHLGRAKDFVNTLTSYFVEAGLREKNQTALNTINFIDEQILVTTDSLRIAETNLLSFRRDNQLVDISLMANQLLNELQALDQQKAVEEIKQQYYNYLITYLERDESFEEVFGPSALGIEDRLLNELINELSRLYSERARLLLTTTERSPLVQATNMQISKSRSTLKENIRSMQSASNILLSDVNRRIVQIERRISDLPQTERELLNIQRRFNLNDATYTFLLEKRAEAGIAMASNVPDNQVIDSARFDSIVAPKSTRNYAIALMLGFFIPLAFIILKDFFNTKILDKREVTDKLSFPLVGIIPHDELASKAGDTDLIVFENPRSHLVEAFRSLRTNLQFIVPNESSKVIVVTSSASYEGKSFTALNLACVFALSGKKTVLVVADLRKPKTWKELNLVKEPGLSNYLIGKATYKEILQCPIKDEPLWVVSSGPAPPNPTELLENERMSQLLIELRKEFDNIIIDTPPVGMVSDATALMKLADTTLYIIRQRLTERAALDFINDFSEKTGIKNICLELNDMEASRLDPRFGYGYGYGYGYQKNENEFDTSLFGRWGAKFFNGNNEKNK